MNWFAECEPTETGFLFPDQLKVAKLGHLKRGGAGKLIHGQGFPSLLMGIHLPFVDFHLGHPAEAVCPHLELLAAIDGDDLLQEDPSAKAL